MKIVLSTLIVLALALATCARADELAGLISGVPSAGRVRMVAGGHEWAIVLVGVQDAPLSAAHTQALKGFAIGQRARATGERLSERVWRGDVLLAVSGASLAHSLIMSGLARADGKDLEHAKLERQAKDAGRGIWAKPAAPLPITAPKPSAVWIAPSYDAGRIMDTIAAGRQRQNELEAAHIRQAAEKRAGECGGGSGGAMVTSDDGKTLVTSELGDSADTVKDRQIENARIVLNNSERNAVARLAKRIVARGVRH